MKYLSLPLKIALKKKWTQLKCMAQGYMCTTSTTAGDILGQHVRARPARQRHQHCQRHELCHGIHARQECDDGAVKLVQAPAPATCATEATEAAPVKHRIHIGYLADKQALPLVLSTLFKMCRSYTMLTVHFVSCPAASSLCCTGSEWRYSIIR